MSNVESGRTPEDTDLQTKILGFGHNRKPEYWCKFWAYRIMTNYLKIYSIIPKLGLSVLLKPLNCQFCEPGRQFYASGNSICSLTPDAAFLL